METSVDPRIRPSLSDLRSLAAPDGRAADKQASESRRTPFAGHRGGTDEVTTLGPGREAKTVEAELRFEDLVDLVNPLQHIPVASSLYRSVSGDEISPAARILGSMIYTGPVGFVYATADSLFAEVSGQSFGETLVASVFGSGDGAEAPPDLAAAETPARQAPSGPRPPEAPAASGPAISTPGAGPLAGPATGQAALDALAADLRVFAQAASASAGAPAPATQSSSQTSQESPAASRETDVANSFNNKMLDALDKYRLMAEARRAEENRADESRTESSTTDRTD